MRSAKASSKSGARIKKDGMRYENKILRKMEKLYGRYTTHYIVLDQGSGERVDQFFRWNSQEAEDLYLKCRGILDEIYPQPDCPISEQLEDEWPELEPHLTQNKRNQIFIVRDSSEIIEVLEMAKHEHYDGGYEGLNGCDAIGGKGECDCGADEINARIDALMKRLRSNEPHQIVTSRLYRRED